VERLFRIDSIARKPEDDFHTPVDYPHYKYVISTSAAVMT
jgi:hypothetical protein